MQDNVSLKKPAVEIVTVFNLDDYLLNKKKGKTSLVGQINSLLV